MEGSNGGSNSPAPFLLKTYEMVDDSLTNSVVSWSHTGHSFVVWNPPEFARDLLPKYFKHNNFSSFIRQLNTYGFRKVDPEQWEFANEEFIRGQRHLLKNIHRRKPIHSHSGQGNAVPLSDLERDEFEKEIEKLKQEKVSLEVELERHKQENQGYEYQLRTLGQTLQDIDQRQQQLMVNLAHLLNKPGYTSNLIERSESPNKKRRLSSLQYLQDEANLMEDLSPSSLPLLNLEVFEKLNSSLTILEKFLHGMDQNDYNAPPRTPECLMPGSPSIDNHSSSPEVAISSTYVDSLGISSICIDMDSRNKPSGVDMNVSPTKTPSIENGAVVSVPAGGNDVFWQQFLTEAPTRQEVESGGREMEDKKDSSGFAEGHNKPWWMADNLTQHMGHLTRVEKT